MERNSFSCLSAGVVLTGTVGRGAVAAVPPVSLHTPASSLPGSSAAHNLLHLALALPAP